jgi:ammonia channel protein AmtB
VDGILYTVGAAAYGIYPGIACIYAVEMVRRAVDDARVATPHLASSPIAFIRIGLYCFSDGSTARKAAGDERYTGFFPF